MALFACIDVALCVDRFQCLGALEPGTYGLRFTLSYPDPISKEVSHRGKQMCPAIPYNILCQSSGSKHPLSNSSIDCEEGWYRTNYFSLHGEVINSYTQPGEKANIKEVCSFRLAIRTEDLDRGGFAIECCLLSANSSEPVELETIKLRTRKSSGISSYLPVVFHGFGHGSYLECTVHSQLINFKFCLLKPELEESSKRKKKQPQRYSIRQYLGCGSSEQSLPEDKSVYYESFELYLSQATSGLNRQLLRQFYQNHLTMLQVNFNILTHRLIDMEAEDTIERVADRLQEVSKRLHEHLQQEQLEVNVFLQEFNDLGGQIYQLWNLFVKERLYFLDTLEMREDFMQEYEHFYKRFVFKNVRDEEIDQIVKNGFVREEYIVGDLLLPKLNSLFLMEHRNQQIQREEEGSCDTDLSEICGELLETQHLFVLVHGFNANHLSLQSIRNALLYHHPNLDVLVSTCNEDATEDHIEDLGRRLAEEIKLYISKYDLKDFKLSFLGHSLGGIVIRAALPYLQCFRGRMQNLLTIGSPHLGYLYHNSVIVKTGLWFINRVHQQTSMLMLTMTDKPTLRDTYLYKLSYREGLQWFRKVTFVSSPEDSYVEESSALIAGDHGAIFDQKRGSQRGQVYYQMLSNICSRLSESSVTRVRCLFDQLKAPLLDRIIGRTAHINYLVDPSFIDLLVLGCRKLLI